MELPDISTNDLRPKELLDRFESEFQKRLGQTAWENRTRVETRLNPVSVFPLLRVLKISFHRIVKMSLWVVLGIIGKRKEAEENCCSTTLSHHSFNLPSYSAKQKLRILHLSDIHLDSPLSQAEDWAQIIRPLVFDFAVITGDFFNGFALPTREKLEAFQKIIEVIPTPIYGILGNHDCLLSVPYLEKLGIRMLLNESITFKQEKLSVLITGLDDPHLFKGDDLQQAMHTISTDTDYDLRLLLIHAPKSPSLYADAGFDLCLCGHTHGGQLCTIKSKPLLKNGTYANHTIAGWWQYGRMKGFTSRGTGTGRLRYRLNCQPEIVLHELLPN